MGSRPKDIKKCPLCLEDSVELYTRKFKHLPSSGKNILEGDWWVYECQSCKEKFTTTESDEISMNGLKQRKL
jgi:hypothetical protein